MKTILIGGQDIYHAEKKLDELVQRAIAKGINYKTYYADDVDSLNSIQELAGSASLFGGTNMLIIRNLLSGGSSKLRDSIVEFLTKSAHSSDDTVIIFFERGNIDKRTKLYKYLLKSATTYDYKEKSTLEKAEFIKQILAEEQIDLRADIRKELILLLEKLDTMTISNEVTKLRGQTIDDIQLLKGIITARPTEQVWELLQLALRDKSGAIRLLDNLITQQVQPVQIVSYLANEFHNLLAYYAGAKFPPFIKKRLSDSARYLTSERVEKAIMGLFNLDLEMKTKSVEPRIILCNYLIHL